MDARVEAERETADEGWPGRRKGGGEGQEGREEEKLRKPKLQEQVQVAASGVGAKNIHLKNSKTPPFVPCCNLHVIVYTFTSLLASSGGLIAIPTKY